MTEVYANGNLLELGDVKIRKVFQINDIGEPKDRQSNYTLPFDIPETPNNVKTFEMLGVLGNLSRAPYTQIPSKVVENSVEIIPDGVLVISKKQGKFKGHIYSGNIFLFDKISNKKINELNFAEYNHGVNEDTFLNSFSNIGGYIYGLSDFGKLDTSEIEINYQVPSFFVHTLWDMIFKEAGIKYEGDIFQTQRFYCKAITMFRGYDSNLDDITNPIDITATSETENATFQVTQQGNGSFLLTTHGNLLFYYPDQSNLEDVPNNSRGTVILPVDSGTYNFSFDISFTIGNGNLQFNPFLQVIDADSNNVIYSKFIKYLDSEETFSTSLNGSCVLEGGKRYIVLIRYNYSYPNGTPAPITNTVSQTITNFSFANSQTLTTLRFNDFIGEMNQIDFVKDIMQEFGLIFKKRRNELTYDFIEIKKLLSDRSQVLDWSDKYLNEIEEDYKFSAYAQNSRFAYNYLESDGERFADGFLKIENENLPIEKTLVTRPYNAPTQSSKALGNDELLFTPFWTIEFNDDGTVKGYKPFSSKNYIVDIVRKTKTIDYKLTGGNIQQYTGEVPILNFDNLKYSDILNSNYSELKDTLDFYLYKKVNLLLNELDIQNLDLFKPIYLKQLASDFYINKINYDESYLSTVAELVRIKRTPISIVSGAKSISLSSFASEPNGITSFNWQIVNQFTFSNFNTIDATITAKQLDDSIFNGGTPTGLEFTDNINISEGQVVFNMPSPIGTASGWYLIEIIDNGGTTSNQQHIRVN